MTPAEPRVNNRSSLVRLLVVALGTVVLLMVSLLAGSTSIWTSALFDSQSMAFEIMTTIRLPRMLLGLLVGAVLGCSGYLFQTVFRNELATPYTLGVSGGASLGVALWTLFGSSVSPYLQGFLGSSGLTGSVACAFVGAVASLWAVSVIAGVSGGSRAFSPVMLLLSGVVVNVTLSAAVLCVHYVASPGQMFSLSRWYMGSLSVIGHSRPLVLLPLAVLLLAVSYFYRKELAVLVLGPDLAKTRGVEVVKVQRLVIGASALGIAGGIAVCGPIGFVGVVVPYYARIVARQDPTRALYLSAVLGALFLVLCDTAARALFAPVELPVGIVTALVGGPFFLMVLRSFVRSGKTLSR